MGKTDLENHDRPERTGLPQSSRVQLDTPILILAGLSAVQAQRGWGCQAGHDCSGVYLRYLFVEGRESGLEAGFNN